MILNRDSVSHHSSAAWARCVRRSLPIALLMLITDGVCAESWRLHRAGNSVQLLAQLDKVEGERSFQRLHCESSADFSPARLQLPQTAALAIDDFVASVEINSNQVGLRLALRMVLPHQPDPRSTGPLTTLLMGDTYENREDWQVLSVRSTTDAITAKVRELRAELSQPTINTQDAYFDACVLVAEFHRGKTFIDASVLSYGPIVAPKNVTTPLEMAASAPMRSRVKIDREQLQFDGQPILLRLLPDHGEPTDTLSQLGVNGIWVSNVHARHRMQAVSAEGLLVVATPPHPEFDPADFSAPLQGLPPLENTLSMPSIWYLGTNISSDQLGHLLAWAREVRSADRKLRRPIMADVDGATDVASRQVDFVGLSCHQIGGRKSFGEVRNLSFARQNNTAQLAFPWEWIQTEAADDLRAWRMRSGGQPLVVEPEQILMQMIACLSAGSRGVGFWKTRSLDSSTPVIAELERSIRLANIYARLVEPYLVQGRLDGHITVQTEKPQGSLARAAVRPAVSYAGVPSTPDGAVMTSDGSSLILLAHWDRDSHYVPQKLYAREAVMTVSATETSSAWRIAATGVQGLRRQPTAGGLYVHIDDFDQLAMIFVSSNPESRRRIQQLVYQNAAEAAQLYAELAELKLARVQQTCEQIDAFSGRDSAALDLLQRATVAGQSARSALQRNSYSETEAFARLSMRFTREVQNRYWLRAIEGLASPSASPHTMSFSTLPDHWKMTASLATAARSENLIPSGSFDSLKLLSDGDWTVTTPQNDRYYASADIKDDGSRMALRLRAAPKTRDVVRDVRKPSLLVRAPAIDAMKGDVFEITAKIRAGLSVPTDTPTPFLAFDDDLGPDSAVSPGLEPSWRTFRFYRQASVTGPLRLWMAIQGAGEVFVDDLTVLRFRSSAAQPMLRQVSQPSP